MSAALSARRPLILGFGMTLILALGTIGWGMMTQITGAVVASAILEVQSSRQIVQHEDGGTIARIHIGNGTQVAAGDLLVSLDGSLLRSELAIVESQLFELQARRGRLEAEEVGRHDLSFAPELRAIANERPEIMALIAGQRALFEARATSLAKQLDQLQRRQAQIESLIDGVDAQTTALTRQSALIAQELKSQQELLDKGLAQSARVLALQREEARLLGQMGELAASRASSLARITETEIEILRLTAARREEASSQLRDIGYRELELAERRRALLERIARLEIRAPVSGVVLDLRFTTPRAVLRAAEPILYLIPQDRPLVIAAQISNLHIDQVRSGQAAKVVFSAFSTQTTPELQGHVTLVSADVLLDETSRQPYYRAEITLNPGELEKLGEVMLLPGMPAEVFIRTQERTPAQFLTKPLTDYFNRAFRES